MLQIDEIDLYSIYHDGITRRITFRKLHAVDRCENLQTKGWDAHSNDAILFEELFDRWGKAELF